MKGAKIDLAKFSENTKLTDEQLYSILRQAGFTGRSLAVAFAVARAESGGRPYAYNNSGPDRSYGIFQINMRGRLGPARIAEYGLSSANDLYQPSVNAAIAYIMSGGGRNWTAWGAYRNQSYLKYL